MTEPSDWASLAGQLTVARNLFSGDGYRRVAEWLTGQEALVGDSDFAQSFADHIDLPGVGLLDYAHRRVHTARGAVLGGIRFYDRDIERPFVEVVAHSFQDVVALRDCVSAEWSIFAPLFLRLRLTPQSLDVPGTRLHKSIYVARYRDLRPSGGRVILDHFETVDAAVELVTRRYRDVQVQDPGLAGVLTAASADDIAEWYGDDQVRRIRVGDATVGLLAIEPNRIGWLDGDEVSEEVIDTAHAGHGFAAEAQSYWAEHVATDRDTLLIGTIHENNVASRRTAEAAGRIRVLDDYAIALR